MPPDAGELRALVECLRSPRRDDARSFRLREPDGSGLDVLAGDIVGLEIAPPYYLVPNFLTPPELARVKSHLHAHADKFSDATISLPARQGDWQPDTRLRRARTLDRVAELMPIIMPKLQALMPGMWPHLRMSPLALSTIECQISVHGDGDFFLTHTDNALPDIAHRKVSYVYYFHREPKQFSGGLLRFYGTLLEGGSSACGQPWIDIDPPHNGLIIFPSPCHHEVTLVQCASRELTDQRLTVNGWFCA
jgi:predicted 2-oxoglutarate/Fe(II)-dependent dioxygenase YbiX